MLVLLKVGITVVIAYFSPNDVAAIALMAIDIGVYLVCLVLLDLGRGRTHFGTLGTPRLSTALSKTIMRSLARTILDTTITLLCYNAHIQLLWTGSYWHQLCLRVITYRSYKRAIYSPLDWSIHLSFVLSLICVNNTSLFWIPLLMIPLPDWPSLQFLSLFTIPKKNLHSNEKIYRVLYCIVSVLGYLVTLGSAGLLEPLMIFGLPIFVWSIPYYKISQYSAQGKEKSIYTNLVKRLPPVVQWLDTGMYLIRVSKYLTLCRVIEKGIGYQVV